MGDIAGGLANLLQMVQVLVNAAVDMQDGLVPTGQKLLGVALTLTVLNDVYQWWIKGDATELLAKGVRLFVITSIPASLLLSEGAWVSANQALVGFFQHGVTQALGAASGADLGDVIKGTMKSIVDAVNVAQPASTTTFSWLNPGSWFAAAAETFSSLGGLFIELVLKVIVFIGVAAMMLGMLVAGYVTAGVPADRCHCWPDSDCLAAIRTDDELRAHMVEVHDSERHDHRGGDYLVAHDPGGGWLDHLDIVLNVGRRRYVGRSGSVRVYVYCPGGSSVRGLHVVPGGRHRWRADRPLFGGRWVHGPRNQRRDWSGGEGCGRRRQGR